MENQSQKDIDLDQLITTMLGASGSPEERQASTKALDELSSRDIVQFIKSLMDLISSDRTDETIKKIKPGAAMLAALYLDKHIKQHGLLSNQFGAIMFYLINASCSPNTPVEMMRAQKTLLSAMFRSIKPYDTSLGVMATMIEQKIQTMTIDNCIGVFIVVESFVLEVQDKNQFLQRLGWFQRVQESIAKIGKEVIGKLTEDFKEPDSQNFEEVNNRLLAATKALYLFSEIIKRLLGDQKESKKAGGNTNLLKAIALPSISELFSSAMDLQVTNDKQLPLCFISTTGFNKIDKNLNLMKKYAVECFNSILEHVNGSLKGLKNNSNPLYTYAITMGAGKVISTLFAVCETPSFDLNEALLSNEFNEILIECLIMVGHLAQTVEIYDFFFKFFKRLLTNVCLVLMKTRAEEMDMFKNEPHEFAALAADTCDKQEALTPKTQAAQLLELICDNIQGSITFAVLILLHILEFELFDGNFENIPTKYPLLKDFANTPFLQEKNTTLIIETCLLALSTISYHAFKRADIVQTIGQSLQKFQPYFKSETLDPLVRSRMCTFICYYFEIVPDNLHSFMIEFLLDSLSMYETYPAVTITALEGLNNIIEDEDQIPKVSPYIETIVLKIAAESKVISKNDQLYEAIQSIFEIYHSNLTNNPELIKILFEALVEKLLLIYLDENSEKEDRIAGRIWRIIAKFSENEKYIPTYQYGIEQIMDPLFNMILNNESAPFGEEMLSYVAAVTKISKSMSQACWKMVRVFPKILLRTKNALGLLFPALNQVIVSDNTLMYEDPSFVKTLVELGIQGLNTDHDEDPNLAKCEFALLLQLILQSLSISDDDWERILVAAYDVLKNAKKSFVSVKLGDLFLSGFISNFKLTMRVVETYKMEADLFKLYLDKCTEFYRLYDRKLLVIGLCTMLTQGTSNPIISEKLPRILSVVACVSKYGILTEQIASKRKENDEDDEDEDADDIRDDKHFLKEMVKNLFGKESQEDDDNEEEDDDEDEDEDEDKEKDDEDEEVGFTYDEKMSIQGLMNRFESKINSEDEYLVLKVAIETLHKDNNELFRQTVKLLPENNRTYLKDALITERIIVENKNGKIKTKPRMIAKVKGIKEIK